MKTRTAARKRLTSKEPSAFLNFIRVSEARLQAVLLRKRYSEQGLVECWRSVPLQVCQLLMVSSNCMPGSPQIQVPSEILRRRSFAFFFSHGLPSRTVLVQYSLSSTAAFMNSSLARTERFSFWYMIEP